MEQIPRQDIFTVTSASIGQTVSLRARIHTCRPLSESITILTLLFSIPEGLFPQEERSSMVLYRRRRIGDFSARCFVSALISILLYSSHSFSFSLTHSFMLYLRYLLFLSLLYSTILLTVIYFLKRFQVSFHRLPSTVFNPPRRHTRHITFIYPYQQHRQRQWHVFGGKWWRRLRINGSLRSAVTKRNNCSRPRCCTETN